MELNEPWTNTSKPQSLPNGRWAVVHLVFMDSYRRLNLAVDGITQFQDLELPYPAFDDLFASSAAERVEEEATARRCLLLHHRHRQYQ